MESPVAMAVVTVLWESALLTIHSANYHSVSYLCMGICSFQLLKCDWKPTIIITILQIWRKLTITAMQNLIHKVTNSAIVAMLESYLFHALMGKKLSNNNNNNKIPWFLFALSSSEMLNAGNYSVLMELQIHVHISKSSWSLTVWMGFMP